MGIVGQPSIRGLKEAEKPAPMLAGDREFMSANDAVSSMLLGLSFECVLKGMWIDGAKNSLVHEGRYRGIPGVGDHELWQLAQAVDLQCSVEERSALQRLTPFVKFAGRYPIPTSAGQLKLRRG